MQQPRGAPKLGALGGCPGEEPPGRLGSLLSFPAPAPQGAPGEPVGDTEAPRGGAGGSWGPQQPRAALGRGQRGEHGVAAGEAGGAQHQRLPRAQHQRPGAAGGQGRAGGQRRQPHSPAASGQPGGDGHAGIFQGQSSARVRVAVGVRRGRKAGWLQCPRGRDREEPAGLRLIPGRWGLLGWVLSNPVLPRLPQSFDLSPVCPVRLQLGHPVPTAGSSTPTSACALPTSPKVPGGLSGGCGTFQSPQFWPLAACGLSRQGVGPCPAVPGLLEGQDGCSAAVASSRPPWLCCSCRDGLPPAPGAHGEGVASPEPTLSVDSDAEWEKKQLLEGEGRAQREGKSPPHP